MNNIIMTVEEEAPIELEYVEAKIKPEQVKDVTPDWEGFPVTPDEGYVLSRVNVAGIPEPTEVEVITRNGDHNVARKGVARVEVLPNLETATVTPTEQRQTVTAEHGDGLSVVTVEPIPGQYIVPSGSMNITENAENVDVTGIAAVNIRVPIPTMPEEYAIGGSLLDKTVVEYHIAPGTKIIYNGMGVTNQPNLERIYLPDSLETISTQTFSGCPKLNIRDMPKNLTAIGTYAFFAGVGHTTFVFHSTPTIESTSFWGCSNLRNIYVPWSEGEVANAPWGATNATITYNYTEE